MDGGRGPLRDDGGSGVEVSRILGLHRMLLAGGSLCGFVGFALVWGERAVLVGRWGRKLRTRRQLTPFFGR